MKMKMNKEKIKREINWLLKTLMTLLAIIGGEALLLLVMCYGNLSDFMTGVTGIAMLFTPVVVMRGMEYFEVKED